VKKILVVFGTRPEAIKMAPVIKELKKEFEVKICITAQHRQMLDQVLKVFNIIPDYDLDIMKQNQDLYETTSSILLKLKEVLNEYFPDLVLVHGDTTTTFSSSLASFYHKIKIGHVEAGLRSNDIYSPYPEEANRRLTSSLATYHFAPTLEAKYNLVKEGINEKNIVITGNTVIDSLFWILKKIKRNKNFERKILKKVGYISRLINNSKYILVTAHRRENFGKNFKNILLALKKIAINNPTINIIYPLHLNPNVREPAIKTLKNIKNIYLIEPVGYIEFVYLMNSSYLILTDSGGIQEEAPSLGKPVFLMRNTTERPEAIKSGCVRLVGTNRKRIVREVERLLNNPREYEKMAKTKNPYGDGKASKKIVEFLRILYETGNL